MKYFQGRVLVVPKISKARNKPAKGIQSNWKIKAKPFKKAIITKGLKNQKPVQIFIVLRVVMFRVSIFRARVQKVILMD